MELRLTGEIKNLLLNHHVFRIVLILEENMVVSFDFEVIRRFQGVKHDLLAVLVSEWSLLDLTKGNDADTLLLQNDEVVVQSREEPIDLGLPELETLMSENDGVLFEVDNVDIVGVDVHVFIADDKFFVLLLPEHKHVGISNIKLVSSVDDHHAIEHVLFDLFAVLLIYLFLDRDSFVHFDQVVTKPVSAFVGQNVEVSFIVDD